MHFVSFSFPPSDAQRSGILALLSGLFIRHPLLSVYIVYKRISAFIDSLSEIVVFHYLAVFTIYILPTLTHSSSPASLHTHRH